MASCDWWGTEPWHHVTGGDRTMASCDWWGTEPWHHVTGGGQNHGIM